jgi:hypothetical protein
MVGDGDLWMWDTAAGEWAFSGRINTGICIIRYWLNDNGGVLTITVVLESEPRNPVTTESFDVYNTLADEKIPIESVSGSGTTYTLTIRKHTDFGISFLGE